MTDEIDVLAKDIADRLRAIEAKESDIKQIGLQIASKQDEIKQLTEEQRVLERTVQSERFVIAERLGKPKGAVVPLKI